jgi:UPF0755 protein
MSQLGIEMKTVTTRSGRRRGPRGGGFAVLIAAVVVLGLVGLVVGAGVRWMTNKPDYTGDGHGSVQVEIVSGDSISQVAATLEQKDVVRSASAFIAVAGQDPNGTNLQPGIYRLRLQMSAQSALDLLLDPAARITTRVLITEGLRTDEIVKLLSAKTKISVKQLQALLASPGQLGLPAYAHGNPEGFLFPATYDVDPGMSATAVLQQMVRRYFVAEQDTGLLSRAAAVHLTPYQVIIIASIVQAEGRTADFPKIARAILNRLAINMPLQVNSSVNFILKNRNLSLSLTDIATPSPYNTYLHQGLPPGPINSPGEDAINAVLAPATGNWIYWVTVNPQTGQTKFTNSYAQFLQFKAELKANGG